MKDKKFSEEAAFRSADADRLQELYQLSDEHLKAILESEKVSVCEACELLGVQKRTVYGLIQEGRLMGFKVNGVYKVPKASLVDFISRAMLRQAKE